MMTKGQLLTEMEQEFHKKVSVKRNILKKQLDAFYDPDEKIEVMDEDGTIILKPAGEIALYSIKDQYGTEVATIMADGVEKVTEVPYYIQNWVDQLMVEIEQEPESKEDIVRDYLMNALLEGRNLR